MEKSSNERRRVRFPLTEGRLDIPRQVFYAASAFLVAGQLHGAISALVDGSPGYFLLESITVAVFLLAITLHLVSLIDSRTALVGIIYLSTTNIVLTSFVFFTEPVTFTATVLLYLLLLFSYTFVGGIILGPVHTIVLGALTLAQVTVAALLAPTTFLRETLPVPLLLIAGNVVLVLVFTRSVDTLVARLRQANRRLELQTEELESLRNDAESRSSQTEARYRAVVEDQTELICRYKPDGGITFVNNAFCRYFDLAPEEVNGHDFYDIVAGGDSRRLRLEMEAIPGGATMTRVEQEIDFLPGGERWVRWINRRLTDPERGAIEHQAVGTDITDMKAVERELIAAKQKADQANLAKSSFLANISHEIRNPLNSITGMMELLLVTEGEERMRYVELIRQSTDSLLRLIGEILDVSAVEAGKVEILAQPLAVDEIIEDLAAFFAPEAVRKGLQFHAIAEEGIPVVHADPLRLKQILHNLIGNALKYTDNGEVRVRAHCGAADEASLMLRFVVSDTGVGIAQEVQSTLFEDFTRGQGESELRAGGMGLGLAISRRLAELMGGRISVESTIGEGSRFELELPVVRSDEPLLLHPALSPTDVEQRIRPTGFTPRRIIVIEDDDSNREIIRRRLELAGHAVRVFANPHELFAAIEGLEAEIVLIDINMPGMSGTQALARLRALGGPLATVPVVAVTGYAATAQVNEFLDLGMNQVVAKPIDYGELFEAIERLCS